MPKSRREALRSISLAAIGAIAAVPAAAAVCSTGSGDAALVQLGEELAARLIDLRHCEDAAKAPMTAFEPAHTAFRLRIIDEDEWARRRVECGLEDAAGAIDAAFLSCEELAEQIRATPATTITGLIVKVRALAFGAHVDEREMLGDEDNMDWEPLCFLRFIRELKQMAAEGRNLLGREAANG
jgi:hypothetical protein